jgi:hypothetical protein
VKIILKEKAIISKYKLYISCVSDSRKYDSWRQAVQLSAQGISGVARRTEILGICLYIEE